MADRKSGSRVGRAWTDWLIIAVLIAVAYAIYASVDSRALLRDFERIVHRHSPLATTGEGRTPPEPPAPE